MDMLVVQGGRPLSGRIRVDGSKNAALPLMAASLMTQAPIQLQQVPDLVDVRTMIQLLRNLGVQVTLQQDICQLDARQASGGVANYDLVRRMRARS